jgi:hypothetical protein
LNEPTRSEAAGGFSSSTIFAWYPSGVAHKVAFAGAGTMHDFSYLGGFLGIVTGSVYLIVERVRLRR